MHCGPKGSELDGTEPCSMCGRMANLETLPGRHERCCLGCSADLAASLVLGTEIDAATLAGQDAGGLIAEFEQLSSRILLRSQSA